MTEPLALAYVGVGSNIEPGKNVTRALQILAETERLRLIGISTFYRTAALTDPAALTGLSGRAPVPEDPDFLNGVLAIHTTLPADRVMALFAEVEESLGRDRDRYDKFAPRTMDLDLLLYGQLGSRQADPAWEEIGPDGLYFHKDIETRSFVAFPLQELAPDLILPPHRIPLRAITASFDSLGGTPEPEFTEGLRSRFIGS